MTCYFPTKIAITNLARPFQVLNCYTRFNLVFRQFTTKKPTKYDAMSDDDTRHVILMVFLSTCLARRLDPNNRQV